MVGEDGYWVESASEVLMPFRKCMYDSEKLMVIDVIVPFSRSKGF